MPDFLGWCVAFSLSLKVISIGRCWANIPENKGFETQGTAIVAGSGEPTSSQLRPRLECE